MLNDILTALAAVVLLGLLLGILLAVFIRYFGIEEDQKVKKIRDALPGINCGACGYAGCGDYAEALAKGTAKPNLCIPGSSKVASQLGEILGIETEALSKTVAFVHCGGTCDAAGEKARYEGIASCRGSGMFFGGPKSCTYGCVGCGDCAKVCPSDAVHIVNGTAQIDKSRCVGCGLCVRECPKNIISMIPKHAPTAVLCFSHDKAAAARKSCKNACIGCGKCVKICPHNAVSVLSNCAVIDYSKCTGCGLCAEACPAGSIKKTTSPNIIR